MTDSETAAPPKAGLRELFSYLREHRGVPFELDVAGRPDAQTLLAALAGVTEKIGLVATQNTTYNDPVDLARRLQTLDLLSGGRAGWKAFTSKCSSTELSLPIE